MKHYAVLRTQHYTDYFIVKVEGKDEDQVRELVQQGVFEPYTTKPRADDCDVDMNEISEEDVQKIEREFGCERQSISEDEKPRSDIDK